MYKPFMHSHSSFHSGFIYCWINCFRHKNHQLFLKWTSCFTKDAEVQCHWISHECLLCFFCKRCQTKSVSGVYFTFKWKDQFLGGKLYFAHYGLKLCLFYFIFAAEVLWQMFFLYSHCLPREPWKCCSYSFLKTLLFQVCFLSPFFASCANFYKTASIWIFYDCSLVIWVILSTKGIRDIHFGYWLREREQYASHTKETRSSNS